MARTEVVILTDDIDGSDATQTMEFGLDGVVYAIDLSDRNAAKLRGAMEKYVAGARRTGGRKGRKSLGGGRTTSDAAEVRAWAIANGLDVSERGRIPADLTAQFTAAHS
jgi:hypothetical protein